MSAFYRYSLFPILLLGFLPLFGNGQTLPPKINTFSSDQYQGHYQILSTKTLPSGQQAFGTFKEVLIHDGENFEHIMVGNGKYVHSMDLDRKGRLFVGGASLIGVILPDSNGSRSFHSLRPLLPDSLKDFGVIVNTHCDKEGGVYFNARKHLFYYKADSIRVVRPESSFFLMHCPSGQPVLEEEDTGQDTGLYTISGTRKKQLPGSEKLVEGKDISALLPGIEDEEKSWTVVTDESGLYRYYPSTGKMERPEGAKGSDQHRSLKKARPYTACRLNPDLNPYGAAYAVGTRFKGIYLLGPKGEMLLHLGKEAGIPAKLIWDFATDDAGNIWAATNDGIVLIHTGLPFTLAKEGDLFSGGVDDISRGWGPKRKGSTTPPPLFLATNQGTWKWKKKEKRFVRIEGTKGQCLAIHPYRSSNSPDRMMIAAANKGVLSVPVHSENEFPVKAISRKNTYSITSLETTRGKAVIQGGRSGVHILLPRENGRDWEKFLSLEDLPDNVRSLGVDMKEGKGDSISIWGGMQTKGVLRITIDTAFTGHHLTHYDTGDGLPQGQTWIFSDTSEKEKELLFGTSQGLYRLKNAEFVPTCRYGQIFCDSSRQVFRFATGSKGELWINDVIGGRIKNLIPKRNGYRIDSTVFRALNLGSIRSFLPERSRTWLGGDQGLACYFPKVKIDPDRKWACRLKKVWGSGDSLLFGGTYFEKGGGEPLTVGSTTLDRVPVKEQPDQMIPELPYSKNRMEFSFAAPFPTQQEAVVYSYKLSGFDTAWSKWTKEVEKEYTNLPEGVYNFKVKARNIYLKESTTAEYRFTILPPWYRTYTAYGLYTFGGIAFIWMIVRLNARRLLAQKQRLEHVVEERTKEIREQKELVEEQKKEVEEQQRETEKQKEKVEEQREIAEERREKIEEAHREITDSIDYAQKIQYALLQSEEQIAPHLPGYFILFKPQSQVSGDFYWSKEHKGHFYIAAVDCTGHGVPGAFMSMLGISQLNEIMNTDELLTPAYILTELRDRVVRELSGSDPESAAKDGMDAALVRIPLRKEGEGKSEKGEERDGEDHLQGEGFNPHREEGDNNSYSKGEGFNPRSHEGNEDESTVDVEFAGAQNPLYVIRKGIAEEPPSVSMEQQGEDRVGSDPDTNPIKPFKKSSDGIEIKGDPMAVGYDEYGKESFTNVDIQLQKGDTLYIFSDGYADQFGGPKGKKFRYGPFKQLLTNIHEKPLDAQKRELDKTFEDWKEESQQEQIDDVVVVGMSL